MLYPDFDELLQLKSRTAKSKLKLKLKTNKAMAGDYLSQFRGHGIEFDEVRKYAIGDDIRKIDWRITARAGTPYVKVFKEERELNVVLCLDMNSYMRFGTRGTFKSLQAAKCAAILGWCASNNNDAVGAYLFGDLPEREVFFRPKNSRYSLWQMLKTLTEIPVTHTDCISLAEPIKFLHKNIKSKSLVFIISDFLNIDEDFEKELSYLARKCQVTLVSVNDAADMDIPTAGNILFSNNNQQKLHISTDNAEGRKAYQREWENNRTRFEQIAAGLNIDIITIKTDMDPLAVMARSPKGDVAIQ